MRKQKGYLLIAAISQALVFSACAPNEPINYKKPAPLLQSSTGVLYKASSTEKLDLLISTYPGLELRPLNVKHHLYEAFNISKKQIQDVDAKALITQNKILIKSKTAPKNSSRALNSFMSDCRNGAVSKSRVIETTSVSKAVNYKTVQLSHTLTLQNSATSEDTQNLWMIKAPKGSMLPKEPFFTNSLVLKLDMVGVFNISSFTKNKAGQCSEARALIIGTHNPAHIPTPGVAIPTLGVEKFYQLQQTNAVKALQTTKGEGVVIAVIDTGVNYNHFTLSPNIYRNPNEIDGNGVDDDGNGFIDDKIGYDFIYNDNRPFDDNGHGSHAAGLAASYHFGIAPRAKIMPLKAMSALGTGDLGSISAAILYAVDQGAHIISLSLGYEGPQNPLLTMALNYANKSNIIVVSAAGNGDQRTGLGYNIDSRPMYPASSPFENIITVAASALNAPITGYSNYSPQSVDILAPGGNRQFPLFSAYIENPMGIALSPSLGTSMATPIVAGSAALVKSLHFGLTSVDIKSILLLAGVRDPNLSPFVRSSRSLDINHALNLAKQGLQQALTTGLMF